MRILMVHNHYKLPGGEDQSFATEASALEARGHDVIRYTVHNDSLDSQSRFATAIKTVWNRDSVRRIRSILRENRVDIAHFQNTFPIISPAGYYAAQAEGVPVVQSLRNYRILCSNALLFRDGRICEECVGHGTQWRGVVHACYRGSRIASGVVASHAVAHRVMGTWHRKVDAFIALTAFSRSKFVAGGLPADRIRVKPNFVDPDPGKRSGHGGYAVYVGRLSDEKGIRTLLEAWRRLAAPVPLKIVGDGPLADEVSGEAERNSGVAWLGRLELDRAYDAIGGASALIFPSECYETFGRTIVEAFATGTPVIAAAVGGVPEMIDDGKTGFLFEAGNAEDLSSVVAEAWREPATLAGMRTQARTVYEQSYSAEGNCRMLLDIYEEVLARRGRAAPQ